VKPLDKPVSLDTIKADPGLKAMLLVTQPRLSVVPLSRGHFERLVALGTAQK
jgi:predicted RNA-binding protein with PUA-like domain